MKNGLAIMKPELAIAKSSSDYNGISSNPPQYGEYAGGGSFLITIDFLYNNVRAQARNIILFIVKKACI